MCRLFGFRSVIPSMVHRSLLQTENALGRQSQKHPDGWGVAYYVEGIPHVFKSAEAAHDDHLFHRVSGVASSESVIAHVRKATVGRRCISNAHPFQYGRWVFAHNGEIPGFERVRDALLARVRPCLRSRVLGDTDSEVLFHLFLSVLGERTPLAGEVAAAEVITALTDTKEIARQVCRGLIPEDELLLNFMVTNGHTLVATRAGKELYWSTHKTRCPDRETCPQLGTTCESPASAPERVNHLLISSEPLGGDNVWQEVPDGDIVGVDANMHLIRHRQGAVPPPAPRLRVV